jgi:hypothetical protein
MRGVLPVMALSLVLVVSSLPGCLQEPSGGGRAVTVTLRVEFAPEAPLAYAGSVTEWMPDGHGNWSLTSRNATDGKAVYIIHNLTAKTALGALLAGATAAGFEVRHHSESMGTFVESIAGIENGRGGRYWSYYVDGEYGTVSSDRADLSGGDTVRWVYLGSPVG